MSTVARPAYPGDRAVRSSNQTNRPTPCGIANSASATGWRPGTAASPGL